VTVTLLAVNVFQKLDACCHGQYWLLNKLFEDWCSVLGIRASLPPHLHANGMFLHKLYGCTRMSHWGVFKSHKVSTHESWSQMKSVCLCNQHQILCRVALCTDES
jgi:hypothetical protein